MIFKGRELLIDEDDVYLLNKYCWSWSSMGYLITKPTSGERKRKTVSLHRMIMGDGEQTVDHINNIKHDNRKCNLRKVSYSENNRNYKHSKTDRTLTAGVTRYKDGKRFQVVLRDQHRQLKWLGIYDNSDDAGAAASDFLSGLST